MKDWEQQRNHRQLVSAQNTAAWASVGLLLPVIGIIIAIIALQKLNYVIETEENWEKVKHTRTSARLWIVASFAASALWFLVYLWRTTSDALI